MLSLIDERGLTRVCDVGGGANPVLSEVEIEKRNLDYSVLDISESELAKASISGDKILADIAAPDFSIKRKFDLVFSKMLAEHVTDAELFHRNVLSMLDENGLAVHFFPTLYSLPFLVNFLAPEKLADFLLSILAPRDEYRHAKFPAYYHWCRGPTDRQIRRLTGLGYELIEYRGFFGHSGYYDKIRFMKKLHEHKTNYLLRNPNPSFTSYARVTLRRA